ncbi:hypothetical protein K458DRAFT_258769, partial [Lentithecium fluviatile CBS 122367]
DTTKACIEESGDLWVLRYINHEAILDRADTSEPPSQCPMLFRKLNFVRDLQPLRSGFQANKGLNAS